MEILLLTIVVVAALDQLIKSIVLVHPGAGRTLSLGMVAIRSVKNANGGNLLGTRPALLTLWFAELMVVLLLIFGAPMMFGGVAEQIALGLVLGGVTGNMIDRVWRSGVIDFVDLKFWPVFNLADAGIVAGVLMVSFLLLS